MFYASTLNNLESERIELLNKQAPNESKPLNKSNEHILAN